MRRIRHANIQRKREYNATVSARSFNSPYLQVYPDVGNITNASLTYSGDILADLESGRGHLAAVHLKETIPGVFREVPYGTGHVNFPAVAAKSLLLGVRMFVGEFWYTGEANWRKVLQQNNTFLREALREGEKLYNQDLMI